MVALQDARRTCRALIDRLPPALLQLSATERYPVIISETLERRRQDIDATRRRAQPGVSAPE
jgi:hypothetical protein